jgi:hypothetical protein
MAWMTANKNAAGLGSDLAPHRAAWVELARMLNGLSDERLAGEWPLLSRLLDGAPPVVEQKSSAEAAIAHVPAASAVAQDQPLASIVLGSFADVPAEILAAAPSAGAGETAAPPPDSVPVAQTGGDDGSHLTTPGIGPSVGRGSPTDDVMAGQDGDDALFGGNGDDSLSGNGGDDRLHGGLGADDLDGGSDADVLFGGIGADDLDGKAGNDALRGGAGVDDLAGGEGNDYLDGGRRRRPPRRRRRSGHHDRRARR